MPANLEYEPNDICVLRITGKLQRAEFGAGQSELAQKIDAGMQPRLLAILENFEGFESGADWNDLDFLFSYSDKIVKIAIVADARWDVHALGFAGAGVRRAPVKFFKPDELTQARSWLAE